MATWQWNETHKAEKALHGREVYRKRICLLNNVSTWEEYLQIKAKKSEMTPEKLEKLKKNRQRTNRERWERVKADPILQEQHRETVRNVYWKRKNAKRVRSTKYGEVVGKTIKSQKRGRVRSSKMDPESSNIVEIDNKPVEKIDISNDEWVSDELKSILDIN